MKIGVIGLGTMGLGIAQVFAQGGHQVVATDLSEAARANALDRLAAALAPRVAKGAMSEAARDVVLAALTIVPHPEDVAPADLVIEAVAERAEVKQALFSALERVLAADTVLATNTSSLSVTAIAQGLAHSERVLGLHFFNPAPAMKLVELVGHPGTSAAALETARTASESAGKTVIACPDRPGFIVNRCARPFYGEALALAQEGRTPMEVEAAMLAAGYKIGPFGLIDLIGADVHLAATQGVFDAMGGHPRYMVFAPLTAQVAKGDLGRKSGQGFVFPGTASAPPPDAAAIALRVEATLVNEAGWLLSEGGTTREGIDTAMKLGLNFPRGPFEMLAQHGPAVIVAELARLQAQADSAMKPRYQPAPMFA